MATIENQKITVTYDTATQQAAAIRVIFRYHGICIQHSAIEEIVKYYGPAIDRVTALTEKGI